MVVLVVEMVIMILLEHPEALELPIKVLTVVHMVVEQLLVAAVVLVLLVLVLLLMAVEMVLQVQLLVHQ